MGDKSQRYPGVKQAVCIKEYGGPKITFKSGVLEIVSIVERTVFTSSELITVMNAAGMEWSFIKDKNDKKSYSPIIKFFDDHFKIIE